MNRKDLDKLFKGYQKREAEEKSFSVENDSEKYTSLDKEIDSNLSNINDWLKKKNFQSEFLNSKLWVIKFIHPKFLNKCRDGTKNNYRLAISNNMGFTWGDGVYVTPIINPRSSMIYGRVGIMGWVDKKNITVVFDATNDILITLYQQWIQLNYPKLYRHLTITVHSNWANRILRNRFKQRFNISLVIFRPDQFNPRYTDFLRDYWFVLSDGQLIGNQITSYSTLVNDCKIVAVTTEEFDRRSPGIRFWEYLRPHLGGIPFIIPSAITSLPYSPSNIFMYAHAHNACVLVGI